MKTTEIQASFVALLDNFEPITGQPTDEDLTSLNLACLSAIVPIPFDRELGQHNLMGLYEKMPDGPSGALDMWMKLGGGSYIYNFDMHWMIGKEDNRKGAIRSAKKSVDFGPDTGWEYWHGSDWTNDDTSLQVRGDTDGKHKSCKCYLCISRCPDDTDSVQQWPCRQSTRRSSWKVGTAL
jgi:hypothetical protein